MEGLVNLSVVESERSGNRLLVHIKAQELAVYTSTILKNENVFDPKVDPELIKRIRTTAYDIYAKLWTANRIRTDETALLLRKRSEAQDEAILLCDMLYAYIGIAMRVFHLRNQRMKYWSGLISDVRILAQKWKESDIKRFGYPEV